MRLNGVGPISRPRQPGAEALVRQRSGPALPPTCALPPVRRVAALRRADRRARPADRRGARRARRMKDASGASHDGREPRSPACIATRCSTWRSNRSRPTSRCRCARARRRATTARCSTSRRRRVNLVGDPALAAAQAARAAGNAPNTVIAAAAAIIGPRAGRARAGLRQRADRPLRGARG